MIDVEKRKKRRKKYYAKKRAERRCVSCGKQDERTLSGRTYCAECYAKRYVPYSQRKPRTPERREIENADKRAWAKMYRDAGMCLRCGAKDKRTVNGKGLCMWCATKVNGEARKRRAENKEKYNEYGKNRREKWKEEGLCSCCGGKKEEPDKKMCIDCRVRYRLAKKRRKEKTGKKPRGAFGMCFQCNRAPAIEGKRLCAECYAKKLKLPQIFREVKR